MDNCNLSGSQWRHLPKLITLMAGSALLFSTTIGIAAEEEFLPGIPLLLKGPKVTTIGGVESINLGFGNLKVTKFGLYDGKPNAREAKQVAHYIGRTGADATQTKIPIRSYVASCDIDSEEPRMFFSVTVASSSVPGASTFGSVYEAKYDPATKSLQPQNNYAILGKCHESHGIAVSPDCSRVAVLCSKDYKASDTEPYTKDIIAGNPYLSSETEDNHSTIDRRINNEIGLLVTTNKNCRSFLTDHPRLSIDDYIADLKTQFPGSNFPDDFDFGNMNNNSWKEEMEYLINTLLSSGDRDDFIAHIKDVSYKEAGQLWLLEWDNNAALKTTPQSFVVSKTVDSPTGGDIDYGVKPLIYRENDVNGPSYAFSTSKKTYDSNYGNTHTSGGLVVIERNDWSMDTRHRGWLWNCGDGHVLNMRAFYQPFKQEYGVICTSDGHDEYFGGAYGQLGSVSVKWESNSTITSGRAIHLVPADNTVTTNGGGHKVIPVNDQSSLAVIVAPSLIDENAYMNFIEQVLADDYFMGSGNTIDVNTTPPPYDEYCELIDEGDSCFWAYLNIADGGYSGYTDYKNWAGQTTPLWGSKNPLDQRSLSKIGILKIDSDGDDDGNGVHWVASDSDCQVSDPLMVDLKNGRYLFGYAKFQCISDGDGYNRIGGAESLIPKSCHLMEIDKSGNILSGPTEVPNHCWGGLDDPVYLGKGRVGWVYMADPLYDNYGGPQNTEWEMLIYSSNSVNN